MFDTSLRARILNAINENNPARVLFVPGETPVPVSGKVIGNRETALMTEAALDGWLTTGRFNDQFEAALAQFLGVEHAFTVNSGSSANLVALSTLTSPELGERALAPGDEVITVAAAFPTTVAPILQAGCIPVFVDIDPSTWNVALPQLEKAISPKSKAIILAHTLGIPYDAEAVSNFCKKHNLWLIEDCCDALGSKWNGRQVGTFGDIATLSFYPAHHITTGEGGAVFSRNKKLARIAESFRDWGRHCRCRPGQDNACGQRFSGQYGDLPVGYDHKYVYSHAGYNLKMTDMAAACGVAQMERLQGFIDARRHNYQYLHDTLAGHRFLRLPELPKAAAPSWFGFPVILAKDAPLSRLELLKGLDAKKIGTRLLFAGNVLRQPFMQGRAYRVAAPLETTDHIMHQGFWLGVWPGLDQAMLDYIAESLVRLLEA